MAGQRKILSRGAEFHRHADLMDQIAGARPDDMAAKDTVGFLVDDHLHKALGLEHRLGAGIAHEGEFANLIGAAFFLQLLLGLADIGDLGGGIDHTGDHIVIHMAIFAGKDLGHGHALILGLMGKHRAGNRIADRIDAGDIGLPVAIGFHRAARAEFNAERPHEALDMATPASRYTASPRPFTGLPELSYPLHDLEVIVGNSGQIRLDKANVAISNVLTGQKLGLRETDTGIWLVSFMHYDLGYTDLDDCKLQTINNPFHAKL